jgi:hypothetical protein
LLLKLINDNANGTCGVGNIIILNKIIKYIVY